MRLTRVYYNPFEEERSRAASPKGDIFDELEKKYQAQDAATKGDIFDQLEEEDRIREHNRRMLDEAEHMADVTYRFADEIPKEEVTYRFADETTPQPTGLKGIAQAVAPYARPVLEYGGALAGGLVGGAGGAFGLNPASVAAGAAVGGGLGYAGGRHAANALEEYAGLREPPTLKNALMQTGEDIGTGAAMEMTGQVAGPVMNMLLRPVPKVGRALYEHVMKIGPSTPAKERETILRTGLEGGFNATKKSLKNVQDSIDKINNEISSAIDGMMQTQARTRTIPGQTKTSSILDLKGNPYQTTTAPRKVTENVGTIDTNEVVKRVDDLKSFYQRLGPEAAADYIKPLEDLQAKYAARGYVTPKEAQVMKQTLYALNRKHYGELSSTIAEGNKAIARGLKEELVKQYPELGKLNARDSDLIALEGVIERAVNRIGNRELLTYGDLLVSGIGAGAGYWQGDAEGGATGAILLPLLFKVMKVPSIQGRVGILLNKASKVGMQGALKYKAGAYPLVKNILERDSAHRTILERDNWTGNNGDL